jgi:hypothetical protein
MSLGNPALFRTMNGGNTNTAIHTPSGIDGVTWVKSGGIGSYTQDRFLLSYWFRPNALGRLWVSSDAGNTFTEPAGNGMSGEIYSTGGFPYNGAQLYVLSSHGAFVSIDSGENWINKTGNLPSLTISRGYGTIVPLWIE